MKQRVATKLLAVILAALVPMIPLWTWIPLGDPVGDLMPIGQAQSPMTHQVFLPLIGRAASGVDPTAPAIEIISPAADLSLAGTQVFEVRAADPSGVASVSFRAGDRELATDRDGADGYRAYVRAGDFPAGPLALTASATGRNGLTTTKTLNLTVQPSPPAEATLDRTRGAILGSASGGTVVIPPDSVSTTATVAVRDQSKDEIRARHGIDYDALGITFLGGFDVQASEPLSRPLGVNTAGFGNRVKPGEMVVTFQIAPDGDGDGIGELIVADTSSVAPDNQVLSDPKPRLAITSARVGSLIGASGSVAASLSGSSSGLGSLAEGLTGRPGSIITVDGYGFNPGSVFGNVGMFRSGVDGRERAVPGILVLSGPRAIPGAPQRALGPSTSLSYAFALPALPPGPATLVVRNDQTGSVSTPIELAIQAGAASTSTAADVIDDFLARSITFAGSLDATARPDQVAARAQIIAKFGEARMKLAQLKDDPTPELQASLAESAAVIAGSGILNELPPSAAGVGALDLTPRQNSVLQLEMALAAILSGAFWAVSSYPALVAAAPLVAAQAGVVAAIFATLIGAIMLYQWLEQNVNTGNPSWIGGSGTSGQGAAVPSGGSGHGNASVPDAPGSVCGDPGCVGGSGLSPRAVPGQPGLAGRIVVKIFSEGDRARTLSPFTGVSDRNGYFFVPLIPEGDPFIAVALDTVTGRTRDYRGTGPARGNSVAMLFDFTSDESSATAITIGQTVSATVNPGDPPKAYRFPGTAGQVIEGSYGWSSTGAANPALSFTVLDSLGGTILTSNAKSGAAAGAKTLPPFALPRTGTQTILVSDSITGTGSFTFTLTTVPVSVTAPAQIPAGQALTVPWVGPDHPGDFIALAPVTGTNQPGYWPGRTRWDTDRGNPAQLRAVDAPEAQDGRYEVRYVSGETLRTLISSPVQITPVTAALTAPTDVAAGASFTVTWSGPANEGDWVGLYPLGAENYIGDVSRAYVRTGNPVTLKAPPGAGQYELRYVSGQSWQTWGKVIISVN